VELFKDYVEKEVNWGSFCSIMDTGLFVDSGWKTNVLFDKKGYT